MPLGNLTSQLFANIYLHELDQFVKHTLKIKYYARYVDDFVLLHIDKNYLLDCHRQIKFFLHEKLKMRLHPDKMYLQHYRRGVSFLGVMIYPWYRVLGKRIVSNGFRKLFNGYGKLFNEYRPCLPAGRLPRRRASSLPQGYLLHSAQGQANIQSSLKTYQSFMSYDGLACHHHCYRLREQWRSVYTNALID